MASKQFNSVDGYSVGNSVSSVIDANSNVSGNVITATANVTAPQLVSNVATGTAPLVVTSTTKVANLNVDLLDGFDTSTSATANTVVVRDASGNISANFFIGNGSQLTGIVASAGSSIVNGTSNVVVDSSGNVRIGVAGTANVMVVSSTTVTAPAFTASSGVFTGNGSGLSAIAGANVTGTVSSATTAGTVTTNAQPNITSVGTLTSLATRSTVSINVVAADNFSTGFDVYKRGNTTDANGSVALNAELGYHGFYGYDGTAFGRGAYALAQTTEAWSATAHGTKYVIATTPNGSTTNATRLTVEQNGNVTIVGNLSAGGVLSVTGNANVGNLGTAQVLASANVTAPRLISNVADGTAPLIVTSTTLVPNLYVARANVADNISVAAGTGNNFLIFANAATGNITELTSTGLIANLSNNSITATTFVGAVSGAATTAGTVTTAAQPNITSVGTLTSLGVNGTVTAVAFTANTGVFTGNGSGLSAIAGANVTGAVPFATTANAVAGANVSGAVAFATTANAVAGANVSGTVASATTAGTVTTAAQPNITSVGTLTSVAVTGNVAAGNLTTTGVLSVTGTGVSRIAGNLDMTSNTIINLATPTNPSDAATKQYVDDVAQGLHTHDSCNAATNTTLAIISGGTVTYNNGASGVGANLTTTGTFTTIDGVTLSNGMRILVKNEANTAHNGIYDRTSTTVLTRSDDFNTPTEMAGGDFTFVTAGTLYDNTGWVMPDPVTTVGTSPVVWVQFSGAGTYTAGTGLTLTGNEFSVNASQTQITSVGTLTGLGVNGTITGANITANTGVFTGNGSALTALNASNVSSGTLAQARLANSNVILGSTTLALGSTTTTIAGLSSVTSTTFVGALTGAATTAGTVTTAAQPNITSVGTLTSLGVNGTITGVNITANTGVFTGNGSGLSAIAGANVTGTVSSATSATSATTAGTVTTAAQGNITSLGTLTGLGVNGTITGVNITANTGVFTGNGSGLSAIAGANVTGTVATANNSSFLGGTAAASYLLTTGTGSSLTAITGANVTGTVASATLASTINVTTQTSGNAFLVFGNAVTGTISETANAAFVANTSNGALYATTFIGSLSGAATSATTAGTVTTAAQPNITSVGTLTSLNSSGTITAPAFTANTGVFTGNGSALTALNGSNITTGTVAQARLANASVTLGSTALTLGSTVTTVAGLSSVTSTTFVGALTGAATTAATVTTAAQPNITSVGTLSALTVSGNAFLSTSSGNVGIGTSSPNSKIQLSYSNPVSVPAAGAGGHAIAAGAAGYGFTTGVLTSGTTYIQSTRWDGSATNYDLLLQPNGSNVGIGTTTPTVRLDVAGDIKVKSNIAYVSPNGANTINSTMLNGGTLAWSGNAGQLFSIADNMTGNIFTVNDVSGIPMISVDAGGNIQFAASGGFVAYGVTAGITAAGSTQGTATALTRPINVVSTVSASTGVILPTVPAGTRIIVMNTSGTALSVYPPSGAVINSAATNVAYSQPAGARLEFISVSATQWYTMNATYG